MDPKAHWEGVYARKAATEVSWYQPHAEHSLALIRRIVDGRPFSLIDVGGGASTLVDDLLELPGSDVTVLDLSEAALDVARERLGARAGGVHWLAGDVTTAPLPAQAFDLWHDRAVFHFLTDPAQRAAYVTQVRHAVRPGGHVIVAAFGPEGPLQCSGLPVVRYAPAELHAQFGGTFELVGHDTEVHHTPGGAAQQFVYCLCVMH
jgi:SAM-dependent methyltransferase